MPLQRGTPAVRAGPVADAMRALSTRLAAVEASVGDLGGLADPEASAARVRKLRAVKGPSPAGG